MLELEPHAWIKEVCPELYELVVEYEGVEDWCLEPDRDPRVQKVITQFRSQLASSQVLKEHLPSIVYILAHLHTALCLQLVDIASQTESKFGEQLFIFCRDCIELNKNLKPEANVIFDRMFRIAVSSYFSIMFYPTTRLMVLSALRAHKEIYDE